MSPFVTQIPNGRWHMYYGGGPDTKPTRLSGYLRYQLGLATAVGPDGPDGPWPRHGQPLLPLAGAATVATAPALPRNEANAAAGLPVEGGPRPCCCAGRVDHRDHKHYGIAHATARLKSDDNSFKGGIALEPAEIAAALAFFGCPVLAFARLRAHWPAVVLAGTAADDPSSGAPPGWSLLVTATFGLVVGTYYAFGLACLAVDVFKPPALYRRRLQPDTPPLTGGPQLRKLFVNLLSNQLLVLLPFAVLQWWTARIRVTPELPPWAETLGSIALFVAAEEVVFYYLHRLLHRSRWLYTHVHKVHHEFKAPTALAAVYAHPVEVALTNVLPLWLGPVLLRAHLFTLWLWYVVAVVGVQVHHSGYRWWWTSGLDIQPDFHDYHHEASTGCYGTLGLLDWVHGTGIRTTNSTKKVK
jgi:methylsterol monooxygenase